MYRKAVADIADSSRSRVRYLVLTMIFIITALNYGDRAVSSQ